MRKILHEVIQEMPVKKCPEGWPYVGSEFCKNSCENSKGMSKDGKGTLCTYGKPWYGEKELGFPHDLDTDAMVEALKKKGVIIEVYPVYNGGMVTFSYIRKPGSECILWNKTRYCSCCTLKERALWMALEPAIHAYMKLLKQNKL